MTLSRSGPRALYFAQAAPASVRGVQESSRMGIYQMREPAGPLASREAAQQKSAGSL